MPHLPDHTTHDPEPVAAYAAGDATGDELALATELVASCAECAALHHDLRAIAAALPSLPASARPRDFQLTRDQAERLRPRGWRRLREVLAGPRFAFAQPLGAGLATLGIAGLLLVAISGAPLMPSRGSGASSGASPAAVPAVGDAGGAGAEAASGASSPAPAYEPYPDRAHASPAASEGFVAARPAPSEPATSASAGLDAATSEPVAAGPKASSNPVLAPVVQSEEPQRVFTTDEGSPLTSTASTASEPPYLALAAALVAVTGFALVALRWVACRTA